MFRLAESIPCLLIHWLLTSPVHQWADLEIMKFPDINMFLIGRFMFRLRRGEVADMFSDFFIRNAEVYDFSTSQRQHFHVPSE